MCSMRQRWSRLKLSFRLISFRFCRFEVHTFLSGKCMSSLEDRWWIFTPHMRFECNFSALRFRTWLFRWLVSAFSLAFHLACSRTVEWCAYVHVFISDRKVSGRDDGHWKWGWGPWWWWPVIGQAWITWPPMNQSPSVPPPLFSCAGRGHSLPSRQLSFSSSPLAD